MDRTRNDASNNSSLPKKRLSSHCLATIAGHKSSQSHIATDGRSVSLGVDPHLGLMTRYLLLFDSYGLVIVEIPF
jgi:hypothetical protein